MKRKKATARPRFRAAVKADALEIEIYGDIVDSATISMLEMYGCSTDGLVSSIAVKRALENSGDYATILLRINSPGGDAFEGIAIHSLLTAQPKPVEVMVDGLAASAASVVAMAGSVRKMGRSAMMMVHDAWTYAAGNSRDLTKMAETLDKIDESIAQAYVARTGMSTNKVQALMDEETWMTAQECVDQGFATALADTPDEEQEAQAMAMARRFQALGKLRNVPDTLKPAAAIQDGNAECACNCQNCMDGDCDKCTDTECSDRNCVDCPAQMSSSNKVQPVLPVESNLSLFEARARALRLRRAA